jgi:hypothetical protein
MTGLKPALISGSVRVIEMAKKGKKKLKDDILFFL